MSGKIFDRMLMKELDVQGLLKVADANSRPNGLDFNLSEWMGLILNEEDDSCGTSGCLIGHFCHVYDEDDLYMDSDLPCLITNEGLNSWEAIEERFSLTTKETSWLFSDGPDFSNIPRDSSDQKEAVKRLYKFLYYKMRKAELLADYEVARKSYDTGICKAASQATYSDLVQA